MTIIEAIKSNKPIRRPIHLMKALADGDRRGERASWQCSGDTREYTYALSADDILADDWEVQEPEIAITATKLREAILRTRDQIWPGSGELGPLPNRFTERLLATLGLT